MTRRRRRGGVRSWAPAEPPKLTADSGDGYSASAYDEGSGPVTVIVVGGGLDDGRSYARLARQLATTNRVLRVIRRQYRADAEQWRPINIEDEVGDVVALARSLEGPCYLFGHSSGGVIALEAALAAPDRFGAVAVFEPAVDLDQLPIGRPASTVAARRAVDAGRPGHALEIFLRDMVGIPRLAAAAARILSLSPRFRHHLIPGQIADQEALERLGDRLGAYAGITQHVLVIAGTKSPGHLRRRAEILNSALPSSGLYWMTGARHGGPVEQAVELGRLLTTEIATRLGGAPRG